MERDGLVIIGFSKFSILWTQGRKSADETVENMERFVFSYIGVPKILQSDNGREFDNQVTLFIDAVCIYINSYGTLIY